MKVIIFCFTCFFALNTALVRGQKCDTVAFQDMYWFKGFFSSYATKSVADKEGNIFMAGNVVDDANYNGLVIKTSKRGTAIWATSIGSGKPDIINDIVLTKDNGVVIAGQTKGSELSGEGWIAKVDANGRVSWAVSVPINNSVIFKVISLADGGFAAVGSYGIDYTIDEYGNVSGAKKVYAIVIRLNADGTLKWLRNYYSNKEFDLPESILQLQDGSLFVTGTTAYFDNTIHGFIMKLDDAEGIAVNTKFFQGDIAPYKAFQLPDESIRISGYGNECQVDKDLNPLWLRKLDFNLNFYNPPDLIKLSTKSSNAVDTAYYFANLSYGASFIPVLIKVRGVAVPGAEALEYTRSYSFNTLSGKTGNTVATPFNNNTFGICGSYTLKGFDASFPVEKDEDQTVFLQTDKEGRTPCSEDMPLSLTVEDLPVPGFNSGNFTSQSFIKIFDAFTSGSSLLPRQVIDCFTVTCCRDTAVYKDAKVCEGQNFVLPGGTTTNTAGIYSNIFNASSGCDSIVFTTLAVQRAIKVSLGNDTCITKNQPIKYKLFFKQADIKILWQDGSTDSIYVAPQAGQYYVTASSACNVASDTVNIFEACSFPVYVPSAFTPNNDRLNDVFRIINMNGQQLISFSIYNRFGNKVFYSKDVNKGWDGKINGTDQPLGTYVYVISYKDFAGKTQLLKHYFVLIR